MPILYCHHESGHSHKVALALSLMGVAFEQRAVDLNPARSERDADFRNASVAWLAQISAQPGWHSPYDLLQAHYPIRTGTRT